MQGIHARGTRASTTRSRRHAVSANTSRLEQADWRTQKQRQGTRRQVQSTCKQEGHAAQAPGPGETRASRMVNDEPNERSVGIRLRLVSEDLGLFLPGAQPVSTPLAAESVGSCHLDWLRLSKMVEQGPHGRTQTSSRVSFDNAMWHGDTVPRMHRQAVPAPWATPGDGQVGHSCGNPSRKPFACCDAAKFRTSFF